jgi:hypothetical protein
VKSHGHNCLPKAAIVIKGAEPGFGRRATAASFRGVKLNQRHFIGSGVQNGLRVCGSRNERKKRKNLTRQRDCEIFALWKPGAFH